MRASGPSELRLRVLSSVVLGAVALLSVWSGGWLIAAVWLGAALAFALEWQAMAQVARLRPLAVASTLGLAGAQVAASLGSCPACALAIGAASLAILLLARTGRDRAWALAGFAYAAPIALVPVFLRGAGGAGLAAIVWIFAIVWTTDIVAYFVGRAVGGPKLWPAVSPKKTWSGFAGGLLGAVLAGLLVAHVAGRGGVGLVPGALWVGAASALASVASQLGDLGESAMKRRFGVKDSGRLIPGHGGFMDRLDGFAAVAALVGAILVGGALLGRAGAP